MTGRKLNDDLSLLHKIQQTNDAVCREHGLSVVEKKKDKSALKISSIRETDSSSISKDTIGLTRWTNKQNAENPKKYYEEHDHQLDAFRDALFALEQRNIDINTITAESIKILQNRLKDTEETIKKQEELMRQNERDVKELIDYQKEIDIYLRQQKHRL